MEINNQQIETMVSEFVTKSKDLGLKVTPQRTAIYKELAKTDQHPSTEMIYKNIKDYFPNISLTTVYRTLETFEKHGLISVVNQLYNAARYDANLTPHHHIVCVECKKRMGDALKTCPYCGGEAVPPFSPAEASTADAVSSDSSTSSVRFQPTWTPLSSRREPPRPSGLGTARGCRPSAKTITWCS